MYHSIVKSIATKNFNLINEHKYDEVAAACTDDLKHRFGGDHALGGERHSKAAFLKWGARLGRLIPDLKLTVKDVWVKGWPWDTTVVVRWTGAAIFPDGTPYANHGVHVIHMAWGKVDSIDANEDSQVVAKMLQQKVQAGMPEAGEPPILK